MTAAEQTKYETLGAIGSGGMATVFLGRARGAGGFSRLVAIKRAHTHLRGGAALTASMKHEASLAARLHHPNVVRVIDVVEEEDELVLVLDYVEGGSLAELMKAGGASVFPDARTRARVVVRIMLDIAAGLDAAHRALDDAGAGLGIVHRDVSPSNVLVGTDGIARLTDFGIAKALEGGGELTETGVLKGKIAYMAPEYIEHHCADASADQFSLGVVTWEGLAGRRLFRGAHEVESLKRVMMCRVPSLAAIEPLMAPLEPALSRALSRSPVDRFASVRELAEALESAARAAELVASPGEVGELVERVFREDLAARRRMVRGLGDGEEEGAAVSAAAASAASPSRGRDDIPTASLAGLPSPRSVPAAAPGTGAPQGLGAAPGASAPLARRSGIALAVAVAVAITVAALGVAGTRAWRGRTAATTAGALDPGMTASEGVSPAPSAMSGEEEADLGELGPAPSDRSPSARPGRTRAGSGAGRRAAPSSTIVPRKAPPNPYLH